MVIPALEKQRERETRSQLITTQNVKDAIIEVESATSCRAGDTDLYLGKSGMLPEGDDIRIGFASVRIS